jgi:hypothetical protein
MSDAKRSGPEPIVPLKGEDAFWLTDLYPEAKALFEHYHAPLNEVVADCMVVLDANVLLLPFEFTKASIAEVERVYSQLAEAGRLVVPGQAAREYYKHRSRKIAAIADAIDAAIGKAKRQIFEKPIPLLEEDEDYQAARELGAEVINKGKEVAVKLEAVNERLQNQIGDDRISALYRRLLGGCVAEVAIPAEGRKDIIDEVARRARLHIAPGFKDQSKEDGGIGDYLVWKAILQEGAARQTHCIFVTEEEKPDWWVKRQGTFQPRPELIDEYRRETGGKSIQMLPLSGLLSAFEATEEVVQQVQQLEERQKEIGIKSTLESQRMDEVDRKLELTTVHYEQGRLIDEIDRYDEQVAKLTADFTLEHSKENQEIIWSELQRVQLGRAHALGKLSALVEAYPNVSSHFRLHDTLKGIKRR